MFILSEQRGPNRDRDGVIKVELESNQVVRDVLRRKSALRIHDKAVPIIFFVSPH